VSVIGKGDVKCECFFDADGFAIALVFKGLHNFFSSFPLDIEVSFKIYSEGFNQEITAIHECLHTLLFVFEG
jgi:hypothetical protein